MPQGTFLDLFDDLSEQTKEFLVYDNRHQTRSYLYSQIFSAARDFQKKLTQANLSKGDKVLLWSENRQSVSFRSKTVSYRESSLYRLTIAFQKNSSSKVRRIVRAQLILAGEEISEADCGTISNVSECWY